MCKFGFAPSIPLFAAVAKRTAGVGQAESAQRPFWAARVARDEKGLRS